MLITRYYALLDARRRREDSNQEFAFHRELAQYPRHQ